MLQQKKIKTTITFFEYLLIFISLFLITTINLLSQNICVKPYLVYSELFHDVAIKKIFPDGKTWVDVIPKIEPKEIAIKYQQEKNKKNFNLKNFVLEHFTIPTNVLSINTKANGNEDIKAHIQGLWNKLYRPADKFKNNSTLLPLPNAYIVPGGRFREVYYWDSYFTMLGLKVAKEYDKIETMIDDFAFLINQYGFIPNGNRAYYLSRSQPPYFSLMVELLASIKGNQVYATYLTALEKEYAFWMDETLPTKHVINIANKFLLNRYYDQDSIPREESHAADFEAMQNVMGSKSYLYKTLRSTAESGWDFSSRWFADKKNISSIETLNILPVDLNCLLWNLENALATANAFVKNDRRQAYYLRAADQRKKAIQLIFYNSEIGWYEDFNIRTKSFTGAQSLAGLAPLFFKLAEESQIKLIAKNVQNNFLKTGGLVSTLNATGQQWDYPNAWAPLQWIGIIGLDNYGQKELAIEISKRWTTLNKNVFRKTGKVMEKYNVIDTSLEAGGGEYFGQDGFGWTNGVFLALTEKFLLK